jgi:energy-coupling factor transporter ATP-binding protein EcfA2
MKILRATFLGVRGVPEGSYDFSHPATGAPQGVVVITGPEASGKTRFVEAILATKEAIGPYGPMSPGAAWLPPGSMVAKVALSFALDEEERQYVGTSQAVVDGEATFLRDRVRRDADEGLVALLMRYEHGKEAGKVEYFPASRRLSPQGPYHGTGALEQRMQRASKEATKYGFVVRFLRELGQMPAEAKAFAANLERLSPSCRYAPGEPTPGLPRCFSSRGGPAVSVSELSETEQQAVLLAATAVVIGLHRSLVLLDRPELCASPERAGALVEALAQLGDDNQLLLASSSSEIIAAVPPYSVIRLGGT